MKFEDLKDGMAVTLEVPAYGLSKGVKGRVEVRDPSDFSARINFGVGRSYWFGLPGDLDVPLACLLPADPAPAAAVERECIRPECRHAYAHTGDCSDREAQARGSQQAQLQAFKSAWDAAKADTSPLPIVSRDEYDKLRSRCSELETEVFFLRKENTRLSGKTKSR